MKVKIYVGIGVNQDGNLREVASDVSELSNEDYFRFITAFENLRHEDFIKIDISGKPFKFVVSNLVSFRYEEVVEEEKVVDEAKAN